MLREGVARAIVVLGFVVIAVGAWTTTSDGPLSGDFKLPIFLAGFGTIVVGAALRR